MSQNPFVNAVAASAYIALVASVMFYIPKNIEQQADTVLSPMLALSLFVLSAAVMGYLFVLPPLRMYLDGEKQKGVNLFLKTLLVFALITFVLFFVVFFVKH